MKTRLLPSRPVFRWMRNAVGLFAVLVFVLSVAVSPAAARGRKVPRGFFGVVLTPQVENQLVQFGGLDSAMATMAREGVESTRLTFAWDSIEPSPGVYNWSQPDAAVLATANHGISILANVLATPQWASTKPSAFNFEFYSPRDVNTFAGFIRVLISRYGPSGTFWKTHPGLHKMPIMNWQIWNEEAADFFWANQPWPRTYTALLRASYKTIHRLERGATVVPGSLVGIGGKSAQSPWGEMRALYAAGAKRYFDEVSIHPFTIDPHSVRNSVNRVITILSYVRREMSRAHDSRKPIIITELAWPAALGKVARSRLLGLETTARGEADRLSAAYSTLGKMYRKLNLRQADWFTWASYFNKNDPLSDVSYDFSGLFQYKAPSTFVPQLALKAYADSARTLEGCRKSSNALRPC